MRPVPPGLTAADAQGLVQFPRCFTAPLAVVLVCFRLVMLCPGSECIWRKMAHGDCCTGSIACRDAEFLLKHPITQPSPGQSQGWGRLAAFEVSGGSAWKATSNLADTTEYHATTSDTTRSLQRNLPCSLHEVTIWLNLQVAFLSGLVPLPMPRKPHIDRVSAHGTPATILHA